MQHNQGSQTGHGLRVQMDYLAHLLRLLEIQFWESMQPVAQLTNEVEFHLESEEKQKKLKSF